MKKSNCVKFSNEYILDEVNSWVKKNCKGNYYLEYDWLESLNDIGTIRQYRFELEEDAAWFTLVWS